MMEFIGAHLLGASKRIKHLLVGFLFVSVVILLFSADDK